MPKEKPQNSWYEDFKSYFLCPEAFQIYFIVGVIFYLNRRADGIVLPSGSALQISLKDHSYIWVPAATTLVINSLGNYLGRCRENRDYRRIENARLDERIYADMEIYRKEGEEALAQRHYPLALENFSAAYTIYTQIFGNSTRLKAKQLYLNCVYKQAVSLYMLKRYFEAELLVDKVLTDNSFDRLTEGKVLLLNLIGLINFKQAKLPINERQESTKKSFLEKAKKAFKQSYIIDRAQNDVYFFLQYLSKNYRFLVNNIPNGLFSPVINLSSRLDGLMMDRDSVTEICAEACVAEKEWPIAICLYDNLLESLSSDSDTFFELALMYVQCFKAYQNLIQKVKEEKAPVTLLHITLLEPNKDDSKSLFRRALNEEEVSLEQLKERAAQCFIKAKTYLDAELFEILDKNTLVHCRINHGFLYSELLELGREANLSEVDDLKEMAIKQFNDAKKLLDQGQCWKSQSEKNSLIEAVAHHNHFFPLLKKAPDLTSSKLCGEISTSQQDVFRDALRGRVLFSSLVSSSNTDFFSFVKKL